MKTQWTSPGLALCRIILTLSCFIATGVIASRAASTDTTGPTQTPARQPALDPTLAAALQAIEQQPTIPAGSAPLRSAGFFSAQHPSWPPVPADLIGAAFWDLGENTYLLSDLDYDYTNLPAPDFKANIAEVNSGGKKGGYRPNLSGGAMPYLTIAPTGANQVLITVFNTNTATYYLQTTPALANTNYPWTTITNGTQTNFTINIGPYSDSFFRVFEATNNPGQGVIAIFIDSPTNGATIQ